MKNSNEWIRDIKEKADSRYTQRKKRRKLIVKISSTAACLTIVLCSILVLPNLINSNIIMNSPHSETDQTLGKNQGNVSAETPSNSPSVETPIDSTSRGNSDGEPDTPSKEPTKPNDDVCHFVFKVNKVLNQISGAKKYFDPKEHHKESWSEQQMKDYYQTDLTNLESKSYMPDDLSYVKSDNYIITFHNNGNIVEDFVSFSYMDSTGKTNRNATILMSKISTPYDSVYNLDSNDKNTINNIEVLIGGLSKSKDSKKYDFYFADFEYHDVHYRIKADNLTGDEFYRIINGLLK